MSVIRLLVFNLSYGYSPLVACIDLVWFPFMVVIFGLLLMKVAQSSSKSLVSSGSSSLLSVPVNIQQLGRAKSAELFES